MVGVLDGLHADGQGGGDVFCTVVDEEDVGGWSAEAFGGVEVDGGLGFGEIEGVGPGVVVEFVEPAAVLCEEARFHGVGHVGEDADANTGALETLRPVDHGLIELAPEVGVGGGESVEKSGGER